jgi:hypothetical protein
MKKNTTPQKNAEQSCEDEDVLDLDALCAGDDSEKIDDPELEEFFNPKKTPKKKKNPRFKKFQLIGIGWCVEVSAHQLTSDQVTQVRAHADKSSENVNNLSGSMVGIVDDYESYDTNLWQSGVLPLLRSSCYALVNDKGDSLYRIEHFENSKDGPRFVIAEKPTYVAEKKKGNVLVLVDEGKGTTAVWEIESEAIPEQKDFTFKLAKISVGDDETLYIDSVLYRGEELERNYDEEAIDGKATTSILL